MALDSGARPRASLIIPLFNKAEYTLQCLLSLAANTEPDLFEVVLVDNASTDGTGEVLASLEGDVQIIRNSTNLGFAAACNQGARAARGKHIVFVNNDTEPLPGWLPPLLHRLDTEPDVGVVGARLLFPDGTIQHAGVVTFENRSRALPIDAQHVYYRVAGDDPRVLQPQDLDVVTGAVMAVRRETLEAVGGFDEGYWNGFEDVDLCLFAKALGWRVVYEPRSALVHHESVSGPERFRKVSENEQRLTRRWQGRYVPELLLREDGSVEPHPQRVRALAAGRPSRPRLPGSAHRQGARRSTRTAA